MLDIWYACQAVAHPFLTEAFVEKVRQDMQDIYIPKTDSWLYFKEGKALGFISMIGNEIGGLFVAPEAHGQGVGTALVDYVRASHAELEVEVFSDNKIGRAFYDKYGFQPLREYFHEESGNNMLRMKFSV